jgi:hypothetical protein
MRVAAISLVVLGSVISAALVLAQKPFAPSVFEYQRYREHRGWLTLNPYPTLIEDGRSYLLAAQGKHGWDTPGLADKVISLKGALVRRREGQMLEVLPGSERSEQDAGNGPKEFLLGEVNLRGEIVDTKCFLGVMNPGNGKVHRECATRCISGGIPPGFLVQDEDGESRLLLLVGRDRRKLNREVLSYVAEPIRIRGTLVQSAGSLLLLAEPPDFQRE